MKKLICPACKKETIIKIMPDFCSSNLWCTNQGCGCEIVFLHLKGVPDFIQDIVMRWGEIWELAMDYDKYNNTKIEINTSGLLNFYRSTGIVIEKELGKYYECFFKDM